METKNIVHEQHYLPRMYLRLFTYNSGKNFIWTMNSFLTIKSKSITEVCWEEDLYELRTTAGINEIEDTYATYENYFAPRLQWIIYKIINQIALNDNDKLLLYTFFQMLFYRNKYMLTHGAEILMDMNLTQNTDIARDAVCLFGNYHLAGFTEKLMESHDLKVGVNKTNIPFITSNFPFCIKPLDVSFSEQVLYFPLTPQIMLMFVPISKSKKFKNYKLINEPLVDLFNHMVCERKLNRDFVLISNDKSVLNTIKFSRLFNEDQNQLIESLKNRN